LPGGKIDLPPLEPHYDPARWIFLPNGFYRVTVHTFDWGDAFDSNPDLPSYTIQFEPVDSLAPIEPPIAFPDLLPAEGLLPYERAWSDRPTESFQGTPIPILPWSEVLFPDVDRTLSIPRQRYQELSEVLQNQLYWRVVASRNAIPQSFAIWLDVDGFQESSPIAGMPPDYRIMGRGQGVVRIRRTFEENGIPWAEVEGYSPPPDAASPEQMDDLKQRFARYAASHADYPQRVAYPGFYAEQVAALTDARSLGWLVAMRWCSR